MRPAPASSRSRLSADQIAAYRRDGYLLPAEPVFAPERFAALKAEFERMRAELPPGVRAEEMHGPHYMNTRLFSWLLDDAVLDLVEPLIGPDIALLGSHFICKDGGTGRRVPWHTDSAYWAGIMSSIEAVTVWLAIDASDAGNGCLRIIPGTHRCGPSAYEPVDGRTNVFSSEIRAEDRDASRAVDLELAENRCSLHHAALMHGSEANTSPRRRCGYTMRYVSARTVLLPNAEASLHFYHARGRNLAGNRFGDPTRTYPEKMLARDGHLKYVARNG